MYTTEPHVMLCVYTNRHPWYIVHDFFIFIQIRSEPNCDKQMATDIVPCAKFYSDTITKKLNYSEQVRWIFRRIWISNGKAAIHVTLEPWCVFSRQKHLMDKRAGGKTPMQRSVTWNRWIQITGSTTCAQPCRTKSGGANMTCWYLHDCCVYESSF